MSKDPTLRNVRKPFYRFSPWYDSLVALVVLLAHHGVALPRPRLAVGEDADVVPLEGVVQHLLAEVAVDLVLPVEARVLWLEKEADVLTLGMNEMTCVKIQKTRGSLYGIRYRQFEFLFVSSMRKTI